MWCKHGSLKELTLAPITFGGGFLCAQLFKKSSPLPSKHTEHLKSLSGHPLFRQPSVAMRGSEACLLSQGLAGAEPHARAAQLLDPHRSWLRALWGRLGWQRGLTSASGGPCVCHHLHFVPLGLSGWDVVAAWGQQGYNKEEEGWGILGISPACSLAQPELGWHLGSPLFR